MRRKHAIIVCAALTSSGMAFAQEAIRGRSVRIIGGDLSASPPSLYQPPTIAPDASAERTTENVAGLQVQIFPGLDVRLGDPMSIRVATEKPGYLVVIDVDSSGRLTQIYPNTQSLAMKEGGAAKANFLTPRKPRVIPEGAEKNAFRFVAAPPTGVGMVVAILSDNPVQMIDLPDVPAMIAGQLAAYAYVRDTTNSLKILPSLDSEQIHNPAWSFAAQFYVIK